MLLCCCDTCCNLRSWTDNSGLETSWSEHIGSSDDCSNSSVVSVWMSGTNLYVTGYQSTPGNLPVLQKWTDAGSQTWSVEADEVLHLVSDGTTVFVGGPGGLYAYDASDGSDEWSKTTFAVTALCLDGAGGVWAATSDTPNLLKRYNSAGTLQVAFGEQSAVTALCLLGGKLWAGGSPETIDMCDDAAVGDRHGHLARYSLTGDLELWCYPPDEEYSENWRVRRLVTVSGRLYAGYQVVDFPETESNICSLIEWDPDSGRQVASFNISAPEEKQFATACRSVYDMVAGSDFLAVVVRYQTYTGQDFVNLLNASLTRIELDGTEIDSLMRVGSIAVDSSDDLYGGTVVRKCTTDNPDGTPAVISCDATDPCPCGWATPFGRVQVDCGCEEEDDGVPCDVTMYQSFTGCFEDFPATVAMSLVDIGDDDDPDANPTWTGSFSFVFDPCDPNDTFDVEVEVVYECPETPTGTGGGTWTVTYSVYGFVNDPNVLIFRWSVTADPEDVSCSTDTHGHPGFSTEWDGTMDYNLGLGCFSECEFGGCAGFGEECPSGIEEPCCEGLVPEVLTLTITNNSNCACIDNAQYTLTYSSSSGRWEGGGDWCGSTVAFEFWCNDPEWRLDFDFTAGDCTEDGFASDGTVGVCDPLEIELNMVGGGTFGANCCDSAGGDVTFTVTE